MTDAAMAQAKYMKAFSDESNTVPAITKRIMGLIHEACREGFYEIHYLMRHDNDKAVVTALGNNGYFVNFTSQNGAPAYRIRW